MEHWISDVIDCRICGCYASNLIAKGFSCYLTNSSKNCWIFQNYSDENGGVAINLNQTGSSTCFFQLPTETISQTSEY